MRFYNFILIFILHCKNCMFSLFVSVLLQRGLSHSSFQSFIFLESISTLFYILLNESSNQSTSTLNLFLQRNRPLIVHFTVVISLFLIISYCLIVVLVIHATERWCQFLERVCVFRHCHNTTAFIHSSIHPFIHSSIHSFID
jgi:amino acid transporter